MYTKVANCPNLLASCMYLWMCMDGVGPPLVPLKVVIFRCIATLCGFSNFVFTLYFCINHMGSKQWYVVVQL